MNVTLRNFIFTDSKPEKLALELNVTRHEAVGVIVDIVRGAHKARKSVVSAEEIRTWANHSQNLPEALTRSGYAVRKEHGSPIPCIYELTFYSAKGKTGEGISPAATPAGGASPSAPPQAPSGTVSTRGLFASMSKPVGDSEVSKGGEESGDSPAASDVEKKRSPAAKKVVKKKLDEPESQLPLDSSDTDADAKSVADLEKKERARVKARERAKQRRLENPTVGAVVWQAYENAYVARYRVKPLRNAATNAMCATLAKLVGNEVAPRLCEFYLASRHWQYAEKKHPLNSLVYDAQKLHTEMMSGKVTTRRAAQREETYNENDDAVKEYLTQENKNGATKIPV